MSEVKWVSMKKTKDIFKLSNQERIEEHYEAIFNVSGKEETYEVRFVKYDSYGFCCEFEEKEAKKDPFLNLFSADFFGAFLEPGKTIEKILEATEEFNHFKKIADKRNEELKETYYPTVKNVYGMDEYADMYVIHFELEGMDEDTECCEVYIDKEERRLYTNVESSMDKIKHFRSYVGWEKDMICQILQHKKIRLQFLFAEDFIREYLL